MSPIGTAGRFRIEPFDPDRHDRTGFSCGIEQVDNYFRKTANKLAKAGNIRLYVMTASDGTVIGFYAINAHAVHYADLPKSYARTRPGHGQIPAAYISMIGRDKRYRGAGHGAHLLVDALKRIAMAADALGLAIVMLDVLDCGNPEKVAMRKRMYMGFGFTALASDPLRLFLPIATIRTLLEEQEREPDTERTETRPTPL
ncbi:GNAT family N-acetyltransferase [Aquibium microcysteis]|uniref:GNAT family N-acetyltransferase n=1 Tax=Aquibium microcysteis TaxID=675281 RepID=UPI00165D155B|nr:GNAT family N-acetyltransferase [Aquibium microcysteis]